MSKELAENAMNATVQCLYIAVDKSIADDVLGRWISYKMEARATIQQLEARVKELESIAPPCRWRQDDAGSEVWKTACGKGCCFEDGGPVENHVNWCHYCGGKVELDSSHDSA
jgi:hypothetical protein